MLNSPKNSSRGVEQCEFGTKEATALERRNRPTLIDCQECHPLLSMWVREYEICCAMPLWRWITGSICLIWRLPTVYEAIMAVLTETHCNRNNRGCHLFPLSSIKTLLKQRLPLPPFILFSIHQSLGPTRDKQPVWSDIICASAEPRANSGGVKEDRRETQEHLQSFR